MSLQITNQADYALRAMLYLARLGYGKRAPSNVIAEEMSMSRIFLSRINTQLVNARLITTWRGAHGGVSLTRPPSEISVYDVLTGWMVQLGWLGALKTLIVVRSRTHVHFAFFGSKPNKC
jgi:Rrf2 family protein